MSNHAKETAKGFGTEHVQMGHEVPLQPFFTHPADFHPDGMRQVGPQVMTLRVEDWENHGSVRMNDGRFLTALEVDQFIRQTEFNKDRKAKKNPTAEEQLFGDEALARHNAKEGR